MFHILLAGSVKQVKQAFVGEGTAVGDFVVGDAADQAVEVNLELKLHSFDKKAIVPGFRQTVPSMVRGGCCSCRCASVLLLMG